MSLLIVRHLKGANLHCLGTRIKVDMTAPDVLHQTSHVAPWVSRSIYHLQILM